jgi:Holliday junction resolvase RusA-like endonuclease
MVLEFTVLGVAQQMGSKRAFVPKGWTRPIITDSNRNLKTWQVLVSEAASAAIRRLPPSERLLPREAGIRVTFTCYLPRPASLPKRVRAHTKAPDLDKVARSLNDALTSIAFHDDAQVNELVAAKRYAGPGESARIAVRIELSSQAVALTTAPLFAMVSA